MFGVDAGNTGFDNGEREFGGVPIDAPAWATDPGSYPILTLPWGAFLDARDNTNITLDSYGKVRRWKSSVASQALAYLSVQYFPYTFALTGAGEGSGNPTINGGTAPPSNAQFFSFDGVDDALYSGNRVWATNRWAYNGYDNAHGVGLNEGYWDSGTYQFSQTSPTLVPASGCRGDGVDDYLTSNANLGALFDSGGAAGTLTFAWYGDSAAAPAFGTNTAQTPDNNAAIFADTSSKFGVYFTTSGVTVGGYDGVARDSGGGPASNDGHQMLTIALGTVTDAIVQVRWGASTLLEMRVATASGIGAWQSCAFSSIATVSGTVQLFKNGAGTKYAAGILYELTTASTRLSDQQCDEELLHMAASVGMNPGQDYPITKDLSAIFGQNGGDVDTLGYVAFTFARANNRTTTSSGYAGQPIWSASDYYFGLGSTDQSGAKWTTFAFDYGGGTDYNANEAVADDTWALVTSEYKNLTLRTRKNADTSTDASASLPSNPRTYNQFLGIGQRAGSGVLSGALQVLAVAATSGWEDRRVADVEAYFKATLLNTFGLSKGTFTLTGNAATLTHGAAAATLTATTASFVETGNAAILKVAMPAALGTFALTGNALTALAVKMPAALATFALTGNAMVPAVTMPAAQASFTLTGNATTALAVTMPAALGTFAETGNAVGLTKQSKVTTVVGAFALTGNAIVPAVTMPAATASFVETGTATGLTAQRKLTVTVGAFTETGTATGLTAQRRMTATQASFTLTGNAIVPAVTMPAATASFVETGTTTGLTKASTLPTSTGTFTETGNAAGLTHQAKLTAVQASFVETGNAAVLRTAMPAAVGTFGLTGQSAGLARTALLLAAAASFALVGSAAGLTYTPAGGHSILVDAGAFALTGNAAGLSVAMPASPASFALTGSAAGLGTTLPASGTSFTLTGSAAGLTSQHRAALSTGTLVVTGPATGLAAQRLLTAGATSYALTGVAAQFTRQRSLAVATGAFALTGNVATTSLGRALGVSTGSFVWTGIAASLLSSADSTLTAATASFAISTGYVRLYQAWSLQITEPGAVVDVTAAPTVIASAEPPTVVEIPSTRVVVQLGERPSVTDITRRGRIT